MSPSGIITARTERTIRTFITISRRCLALWLETTCGLFQMGAGTPPLLSPPTVGVPEATADAGGGRRRPDVEDGSLVMSIDSHGYRMLRAREEPVLHQEPRPDVHDQGDRKEDER